MARRGPLSDWLDYWPVAFLVICVLAVIGGVWYDSVEEDRRDADELRVASMMVIDGRCHTGYLYDAREGDVLDVPAECVRHAYPAAEPQPSAADYALQYALWTHLLAHSDVYGSPRYYDRVLVPVKERYHAPIATKAAYSAQRQEFATRNAPAIATAKTTVSGKDGTTGRQDFKNSNSNGGNVRPAQPARPAGGNGGGAGAGRAGSGGGGGGSRR